MQPVTLVTGLMAANIFLSGAAFAALVPFRAIIGIEELGLSNAQFGIVMALSALGGAGIALLLGNLSDRVQDRRSLVLLSAIMGALGLAVVWAIRSPIAFTLAFCLLLPFGGALFSQSFSYARSYFDRERPARAEITMSYLRAGFTLAWIVLPPIAGWVAVKTSSFGAAGLAAAAQVGCILCVALLWKEPSSRVGIKKQVDESGALPPAHLPLAYRFGILGVVCGSIGLQLNIVALPLVIMQDLGGSLADVGLNAAIAAAIEVPAMIGWGYLALRVSKEIILTISCVVFAAYFGAVVIAETVLQVMFAQVLAAIAIGAFLGISISYLQDAIRGRVGLSTSLIELTNVTAAMVAAGLFAVMTGASYATLMIGAAWLCVVGAVMLALAEVVRRRI
ncbi:MFS transporter [Loktanella sp. S4079]|uniref:MFS transporter n=1 Tax=Loktanella sp. S4079 TaxID=579483 RepID=UPI0005F9B55B|nr:MFS transporter [Loktanella sp. S4079]KJZ19593.1 hypothetical protein TW80_01395 [Loktanella sp. S4079]